MVACELPFEAAERFSARPALGLFALEGALAELERLGRLVDGLLALSRAAAGAAPAEEVDLADVVHDRVQAWSALAQERALTLVAETDGTPSARAAPKRIRQVLDNRPRREVSERMVRRRRVLGRR